MFFIAETLYDLLLNQTLFFERKSDVDVERGVVAVDVIDNIGPDFTQRKGGQLASPLKGNMQCFVRAFLW